MSDDRYYVVEFCYGEARCVVGKNGDRLVPSIMTVEEVIRGGVLFGGYRRRRHHMSLTAALFENSQRPDPPLDPLSWEQAEAIHRELNSRPIPLIGRYGFGNPRLFPQTAHIKSREVRLCEIQDGKLVPCESR